MQLLSPQTVLRRTLIAGLTLGLAGGCGDPPPDAPRTTAPAPEAPVVTPDLPPEPTSRPARTKPRRQARAGAPSLLIFTVDTLRADRLGTYGYDRLPTSPLLDAFAREAVVFEQAYAPSPWTLPTVVSVMTSTYPCEHGALTAQDALADGLMPLAERLQAAGYTTLSLTGNDFAGKASGLDRGFDVHKSSVRNDRRKVTAVLNRWGSTPFFLYVHNTEPHNPYHFAPLRIPGFPPVGRSIRDELGEIYRAYRKATRVDFFRDQAPGTTDTSDEQLRLMTRWNARAPEYDDLYDASVRYADRLFGGIVKMLGESGGLDQTIIVFISDHGEEFFEHGGWTHDQSVYEELLRVPLLIRFPGGKFGGQRIARPVSLLDIMPTLADYMQIPGLAEGTRGTNLMPLIRGQVPPGDPDGPQIVGMRDNRMKFYRPWAEGRGDVNIAVRLGPYKGIWNVEPDTVEVYDLTADPGEQDDLAGRLPAVAEEIRTAARTWFEACAAERHTPAATREQLEALENLRTLGYVD